MLCGLAVDGSWSDKWWVKLNRLESLSVVGDTPVGVCLPLHCNIFPSSTGLVEFRVNLAGPSAKPKYSLVTDSVTACLLKNEPAS